MNCICFNETSIEVIYLIPYDVYMLTDYVNTECRPSDAISVLSIQSTSTSSGNKIKIDAFYPKIAITLAFLGKQHLQSLSGSISTLAYGLVHQHIPRDTVDLDVVTQIIMS